MPTNNKLPAIFFALIACALFTLAGQFLGSLLFIRLTEAQAGPGLTLLYRYFIVRSQIPSGWIIPLYLSVGVSVLIGALPLLMALVLLLSKSRRELHGSARFANRIEIKQAGLLLNDKTAAESQYPDLLLGKAGKDFLRWSSNTFLYLAAPTRSGKGVGIVIPNCLHYRGSMVVYDPKLENFLITGGFREQKLKQKVFLFNPSGVMPEHAMRPDLPLRSHRWNPMTYIRRHPAFMYKDAAVMASILIPKSENGSGSSKFFEESAQKLMIGLILYLIETEAERIKLDPKFSNPRTLSTLSNLFRLTAPEDGQPLADWLKTEIECRDSSENPNTTRLSGNCKTLLYGFANGNAKTGGDIVATLTAPLGIFLDPVVEAATSGNDFDLRDVRCRRMSIFLGLNPTDTKPFANLTNLFFSQLITVNINQGLPENFPDAKHQCLLLMDEFTALGAVPAIEHGIAYIAGYGLRLLIIIQTQSQVAKIYGKEGAQIFWSNFEAQVVYPPNTEAEAKEYSELIGYETYKTQSKNRQKGKMGHSSTGESDQKRAVMLPQELRLMPKSDCIVTLSSTRPVYAQKIIYYREPVFQKRANLAKVEIPELHLNMNTVSNRIQASINSIAAEPQALDEETLFDQGIALEQLTNAEAIGKQLLTALMPNDSRPEYRNALQRYIQTGGETMSVFNRLLMQII